MKFGKIFLVMAIVLAVATISIAAAEEASLAGHTFTIPDGFKKVDMGSDKVGMSQDDDHAIVLTIAKDIKTPSELKASLEKEGYKFLSEDTYVADGKNVSQQNYNNNGSLFMAYTFDVDSDKCFVTYVIPENETPGEGPNNPVTVILDSIK